MRPATSSAWASPSSDRWSPLALPGSTWPVVGVRPWRTSRTTVGRSEGLGRLATPAHRTRFAGALDRPVAPHLDRRGPLGTGEQGAVVAVLLRQGGRPPVPPAEQHGDRGDQQGPDEEGVKQDPGGEADADLHDLGVPGDGEDPEGPGQDEPG